MALRATYFLSVIYGDPVHIIYTSVIYRYHTHRSKVECNRSLGEVAVQRRGQEAGKMKT